MNRLIPIILCIGLLSSCSTVRPLTDADFENAATIVSYDPVKYAAPLERIEFTTYNIEDISAMTSDSHGNIWIGRGDTVGKYDGNKWDIYKVHSADVYNVRIPIIKIMEGSNGYIWVASSIFFINKYDGENWTTYESSGLFPDFTGSPHLMLEDSRGNIWVTSHTEYKINKFDGKNWKSYSVGNLLNFIQSNILEDTKGNIWVGTQHGLYEYNGREWITHWLGFLPIVKVIEEDSNGNIWVGAINGVYKYDGKDLKEQTTKEYPVKMGIGKNLIKSDRKGNIWISSSNLYERREMEGKTVKNRTEVCLFKYDGNRWMVYTIKDGFTDNYISALHEDSKGIMWAGTAGGVSKFNGENWITYKIKDNYTSIIKEDSRGNIWFGGSKASKFDGQHLTTYSTTNGLADGYVRDIEEDEAGNIWILTTKGLSVYKSRL